MTAGCRPALEPHPPAGTSPLSVVIPHPLEERTFSHSATLEAEWAGTFSFLPVSSTRGQSLTGQDIPLFPPTDTTRRLPRLLAQLDFNLSVLFHLTSQRAGMQSHSHDFLPENSEELLQQGGKENHSFGDRGRDVLRFATEEKGQGRREEKAKTIAHSSTRSNFQDAAAACMRQGRCLWYCPVPGCEVLPWTRSILDNRWATFIITKPCLPYGVPHYCTNSPVLQPAACLNLVQVLKALPKTLLLPVSVSVWKII